MIAFKDRRSYELGINGFPKDLTFVLEQAGTGVRGID